MICQFAIAVQRKTLCKYGIFSLGNIRDFVCGTAGTVDEILSFNF